VQEFDQKVAFVTGAGGGMGYRVACDLLAAGAKVLMFDLKPQPETIPGDSDQSIYVQGDLTDEAEVATACARAIDAFGGIDCLANVAGALWFGRDRSALEMELDVWDQVMAINRACACAAAERWCIFRRPSACAAIRRRRTPTRRPRPGSSPFPNR
jgi:NAD(P)-dependent dehydrogenase (short-subunit alcohol dehydrogenase family)